MQERKEPSTLSFVRGWCRLGTTALGLIVICIICTPSHGSTQKIKVSIIKRIRSGSGPESKCFKSFNREAGIESVLSSTKKQIRVCIKGILSLYNCIAPIFGGLDT